MKVINKYLPTYLIIAISGIPFLLNDTALIVYFLYILVRVIQTRSKILWIEVFTILAFVLIFCIQFYLFGVFSFTTLTGIVLRMLTGLFYLKVEGKEFVAKYVKTMQVICLISLIAYLTFNIFPGLYYYLEQKGFRNSGEWNFTTTIFVYQFSPINTIYRNIGPFWEPGIFGIFINISLFFKLFILEKKLKNNLLEIASVLTTFSTTNYLIFFVLLILYYAIYSRQMFKVAYILASVTLFIVIFLNSDFLYNKLTTQIREAKIEGVILNEGRFVSIIRDYEDLKKSWVTGTGFLLKNRFYYSPWRTHSNCGFTDIVVKLGLFGSLFYFILLYRGAAKIFKTETDRDVYLINIIFLLLLFLAGISEIVYSMSLFMGLAISGSSKRTTFSTILQPA